MQIKELMTRNVDICAPGTSLSDAAKMMRRHEVGFLPVGEGDRLMGVVTDRDIVVHGLADGRDPQTTRLQDIMSGAVLYLYDDQSVEEAAKSMAENAVRRMAVVNRDKRLTGVISLGDLAGQGLEGEAGKALQQIAKAA